MSDEQKFFSYNPYNDSYTRLCKVYGICTKSHASEAIEEYLIQGIKYLSFYAKKIEEYQKVPQIFFDTVIDVLFYSNQDISIDKQQTDFILKKIATTQLELKNLYQNLMKENQKQIDILIKEHRWHLTYKINEYILEGEKFINQKAKLFSQELTGLYELLILALKGLSKTAIQIKTFQINNDEINKFFLDSLYILINAPTEENIKQTILKSGEINLKAIELLKNTIEHRYGIIEQSKVRTTPIKGKAILVTGNDIQELENILKFSLPERINIYTHGEMLYAHILKELKQFENLIGHYGIKNTNQQLDIENFPGPVFITCDCSWTPPEVFRGRLFTTAKTNLTGIKQIENQNYKELIKVAQDAEGFLEDSQAEYIEIGLNQNIIKNHLKTIENALKEEKIDKIFLLSGCNNSDLKKKYIDKFIKNLPEKSLLIKFAGISIDETQANSTQILDFGIFNNLITIFQFLEKNENFDLNLIKNKEISLIFFLREQSSIITLFSAYTLLKELKHIKIGACSSFSKLAPTVTKALEKNFSIKTINSAKSDIKDFMDT